MGAGKSAVGRQLALKLNRQFLDTDHDVVSRTGVDISFIFEKEGEEGFRKRETESLIYLCQKENVIVSTGGGSVARKQNREIISGSGLVIYLHASVAQQVRRTKKKDNRPLLQTRNPEDTLARLMNERELFYREVSDLVVNTDGQKVNNVVDKIIEKLESIEDKIQQISSKEELLKVNVITNSRSYPAFVGSGIIKNPEQFDLLTNNHIVVVTDENLEKLYRKKLESFIKPASWFVVPASETSKSFDTYQWLLTEMVSAKVKRDSVIVGIGGGVVGDLSGFVGATFMRGIKLVHIPTSLLAMVDSSIGGKTGINLPRGKNLVGSIYQPHTVIADIEFIKTLPEREYKSGLAEVIKYGLLHDEAFLAQLEDLQTEINARDPDVLSSIVHRCIAIKAQIVEEDEQDHGKRMLLNLGHTFAHVIETLQAYKGFKHGEAVAIGMCMAADLSEIKGQITLKEVKRIKSLIRGFGLPTAWSGYEVDEFSNLIQGDKKNTLNTQRFILLKKIGEAYIDESVTQSQLQSLLNSYQHSDTEKRNSA